MKLRWVIPLVFAMGTFFIFIGAADSLGLVEVTNNATAMFMVGVGCYMLGASFLRSLNRKVRRKP